MISWKLDEPKEIFTFYPIDDNQQTSRKKKRDTTVFSRKNKISKQAMTSAKITEKERNYSRLKKINMFTQRTHKKRNRSQYRYIPDQMNYIKAKTKSRKNNNVFFVEKIMWRLMTKRNSVGSFKINRKHVRLSMNDNSLKIMTWVRTCM